jgi:hypothetical protein
MESEAAARAVQLLEQLTDKIGAKATDLWPHYVNFVRMQAWTNLIQPLAVGILAALFLWYGFRNKGKVDLSEEPTLCGIGTVIVLFLGVILLVVALIGGSFELSHSIPTLIDPEGAALQRLLRR